MFYPYFEGEYTLNMSISRGYVVGSDSDIAGPSTSRDTVGHNLESSDSYSDSSMGPPPSKKHRRQAFSERWLDDPSLGTWIRRVNEDRYKVLCIACDVILRAGRSQLMKHSKTNTHKLNMTILSQKDSENSIASPAAAAPTDMYRKRSFQEVWFEEPNFASWIEKLDTYTVKCIACERKFMARRSMLEAHMVSEAHKKNMGLKKIGKIEDREKATGITPANYATKMREAEIRYCLAIVEHNLSFKSQIQFLAMSKTAFPDSDILRGILLTKGRISAVIRNVISKYIKITTTSLLQDQCFSIIIDESADTLETKSLCILARYIRDSKIQTYLLDYFRVAEGKDGNLYQCFLHSLNNHNLSINNIVSISVENASAIIEKRDSFVSRLLEANHEVAVFSCILHSMHQVASRACECLPPAIDDFLHLVSIYVSKNAKRREILENTQNLMNVVRQKMYRPCGARWLATSECIQCILDQWQDLYAVFAEECTDENSMIAPTIFEHFNNPYTLAYLQFLDYTLKIFCNFTTVFQGSGMFMYQLLAECYRFIRHLGGNFLKLHCTEDVEKVHEVDVDDENNIVPLQFIFVGQMAALTIEQIANAGEDEARILEFYVNVRKFYICAFKEAVQRLPFDDNFLQALQFLKPEVALYLSKHEDHIGHILSKFPTKFKKSTVIDEWRLLPSYFDPREKEKYLRMDILKFWERVSKLNSRCGAALYDNICKVAFVCLSLPHSNADIERLFNLVSEIRTSDALRFKPETVCALTRIKLDLDSRGENCVTYDIPQEMVELFDRDMHERSFVPETLQGTLLTDVTDTSDSDS